MTKFWLWFYSALYTALGLAAAVWGAHQWVVEYDTPAGAAGFVWMLVSYALFWCVYKFHTDSEYGLVDGDN